MSNIDWDNAPEGAEFYGLSKSPIPKNAFFKFIGRELHWFNDGGWKLYNSVMNFAGSQELITTLTPRPAEWPEEDRIDAIAQNGGTGDHYHFVGVHEIAEAKDFLSEGLKILAERGKQYGSNERECSFSQVAQAFNAITGNDLKGSDICLILALVKQVRQYAQPDRFHEDSAVDGVNYTALQAQELKKERK